jgi:hypothetical protein
MGLRDNALIVGLTLNGLRTTPTAIANYLNGFNFSVTNSLGAPSASRTMQNALIILRYLRAMVPLLMLQKTRISPGDAFSVLQNFENWCPHQ